MKSKQEEIDLYWIKMKEGKKYVKKWFIFEDYMKYRIRIIDEVLLAPLTWWDKESLTRNKLS